MADKDKAYIDLSGLSHFLDNLKTAYSENTTTGSKFTVGQAGKLSTARTVSFATGDVTGSFSFDGSANVSDIALTVGEGKITNAMLAGSIAQSKITNLTTDLENKVDKVTGKGLSTNDLTDALKDNYDAAYTHSQSAHAPSDAEKNIIVSVKRNGTALTVDSDRAVDVIVPVLDVQTKTVDGGSYASVVTDNVAQIDLSIYAKTTDIANVFKFMGSCTGDELAAKAKTRGHVWFITATGTTSETSKYKKDYEYACNGTDWVELGGPIDLSNYVQTSRKIAGNDLTADITVATMQSSLGLGSAAYTESSAYATAAQGAKADTAVQSVVAGTSNGQIKVDGTDVTVYTHPSVTAVEASAKKVGYDSLGHVVLGAALTASDVGALADDVNYAGSSSQGGAANSVANSVTFKFDSGSTEGTDLYTFNGSAVKTIDIKAGDNVTLTKAAGSITIAATDTVYTHPTDKTAHTEGLYKIANDTAGHVTSATAVQKSDITALGIPGQDTTYEDYAGTATHGLVPGKTNTTASEEYYLNEKGEWGQITSVANSSIDALFS